MIKQKLLKQFLVEPGSEVNLKDYVTDWTETDEAKELGKDFIKERAAEILEETRKRLSEAQELLYASDTHSVLIILQAMDAAGKDGTIRHVMSGVNPQGCQVFSFKKPSSEELDHNFLWRYMKSLPERGRIGIMRMCSSSKFIRNGSAPGNPPIRTRSSGRNATRTSTTSRSTSPATAPSSSNSSFTSRKVSRNAVSSSA
jgi:hypothetical protein